MHYDRLRLQYLASYGLTGSFLPYAPLFLKQLGLTDAQINLSLGVQGIAVITMPMVTTYLADHHVPNRLLLRVSLILSALMLLALCDAGGFLSAMVLMILFALASTSISSLTDGLSFALIHQDEARGKKPPPYHSLRLWGSIGFILPTIALFFVFRAFPEKYWIAMLFSVGSCLLGAATTFLLPAMRKPPGDAPRKIPTLEAFASLKHRQLYSFIGPLFLLNSAMYIIYNLYSRRLQDVAIDGSWIGMITSVGVVFEILSMLCSGWILHHIGVKGTLLMGGLAITIRMLLLALVDQPLILIASQILHGPIIMCMALVPPMYLNAKATGSNRNSMQGMYVVLCYGLARLLSPLVSSPAAEIDLRYAFLSGAAMSAIALVWAWLQFTEDAVAKSISRRAAKPIEAPLPETP